MGSNTEKNQSTKLIQKFKQRDEEWQLLQQKLFRILIVAIIFSPSIEMKRYKDRQKKDLIYKMYIKVR